jgi:hypothetical protein
MHALKAKFRQETFEALVEGDPIGRRGSPPGSFDVVLKAAPTARVSELAAALGGIDPNRVAYHLLARGYAPSESDPDVYERRAWYSAYPWPAVDAALDEAGQ